MAKLKNPINGFIELGKKGGVKYLRFRKLEYYALSEHEIMRLHPVTGQRTMELYVIPEVETQRPIPRIELGSLVNMEEKEDRAN